MLNRLLAISLLLALISSNCSRYFVYAGFEVNQGYIAKTLCENKARPWMHCNGRCYLIKKLKEAGEKEKKQGREDQKNQYQDALMQPSFTLCFYSASIILPYQQISGAAIVQRSLTIFQPPRVNA
ncbi:hypothetical protein [Mucilaginibacter sp.]